MSAAYIIVVWLMDLLCPS